MCVVKFSQYRSVNSLKVVVNGPVSEAHEINSGVTQRSLLGSIFFPFYIIDLPKNIPRSLLNIYADDATVYDCTFQKSR